jgi:triosephosphate isomerase
VARRPLIAGNWKMNGGRADALRWARAAAAASEGAPNDVAIFPPFVWLAEVALALAGAGGRVALGAQACHDRASGAHTGAIAAPMLREVGCALVLCGHSERRQAGEDDAFVAGAIGQALAAGLTPVLCVGETRDERRAGRAEAVLLRQLDAGFLALGPSRSLVVAYEPVWAIGTGETATPEQAGQAHGWVRRRARALDPAWADSLRILYGGSVNPGNIDRLLAAPDVDGALVGGASLDPDAFARLVRAVPSSGGSSPSGARS